MMLTREYGKAMKYLPFFALLLILVACTKESGYSDDDTRSSATDTADNQPVAIDTCWRDTVVYF